MQDFPVRRRYAYHLRDHMRTRLIVLAAFVAFLGIGGVAGAYFYDDSKKDLIAEGVKVNGVPIGGMTRAAGGEEALRHAARAARPPREGRLQGPHVHAARQKAAAIGIDIRGSVDKALKRSQEGSMFSRSWRNLRNQSLNTELAADVTYNEPAIDKLVKRVRKSLERKPVDAKVDLSEGQASTSTVPHRPAREVQHAGQGASSRRCSTPATRGPGEGQDDRRAAEGLDRSSWPRSTRRC